MKKLTAWLKSLKPQYKRGDQVSLPASLLTYAVVTRYWFFGWYYDVRMTPFSVVHPAIHQRHLTLKVS